MEREENGKVERHRRARVEATADRDESQVAFRARVHSLRGKYKGMGLLRALREEKTGELYRCGWHSSNRVSVRGVACA